MKQLSLEKNRVILGPTIDGQLIKFNNAEELINFFCVSGFDPYQLEEVGVNVKVLDPDDPDSHWHCEFGECLIAPIFNRNRFFNIEDEYMGYNHAYHYKPEDLELDSEIYSKFPLVIYMNVQTVADRVGDSSLFIWNVSPIEEMKDMEYINNLVDQHKVGWLNKLNSAIEFETKREEWMKENGS